MNTVDGYAMSSWERGYGDFVLVPDLGTLRHLPWHEATALVDRRPGLGPTAARWSPRPGRSSRPRPTGWPPAAGPRSPAPSWSSACSTTPTSRRRPSAYRDLTPANLYNVDYSILGTGRVEPLMRRIRLGMSGAGMYVESSKGECNLGQHEIAFRYADAVTTCDNHSIYKTGAKEIAAQEGMSITFMAKPNAREGNSCHIHLSLRDSAGSPVLAGDGPYGLSPAGRALPGRAARRAARAHAVPRAERQLLQALRARAASPRPRCAGAWTTGPAPCAWSGTGSRCARRTGCPAATSTPTWRSPR